ncbi:MAG: DUF4465 domain-containing protein [Muribaculaceae bacterium]|nr:DUF4465 domain-containing protein [Muribaculaceae bacterium]MDE7080313.1 DUF4465 domain-containing protein [Muribaculaceae bacterium]
MKKLYSLLMMAALTAAGSNAAELQVATFEDLNLPAESWWVGDTEDEDYALGTFTSGSFEFSNFYMADYDSWGFFGYASETGNVFPGGYAVPDQMLNCVGGGYESATYGMGFIADYMGPSVIRIPDFEETGVNVNGVWVTNNAWVVSSILEGDGMSDAFGQGDYLKLTFKGFDKDGNAKSVDFMLADYTSEDASEHYYVDSWRYFDLSSLGDVVSLQTDMESTKVNDWGMTTPAYFAFDDLGAAKPGSVGVAGVEADLAVRVSVKDGVATVAAAADAFSVEAVSLDGIRAVAQSVNGAAHVQLPAVGVNILRVVTPEGTRTLKVLNK